MYLTLLATHIARRKGLTLTTDSVEVEPLANRVFRGDTPEQFETHLRPIRVPGRLAEGLLASLTIATVNISSSTPADKIVKFRDKYQDELGKFRSVIRGLTESLTQAVDPAALSRQILTIHAEEVAPQISSLKRRLREAKISCGMSNLTGTALMSLGPTAIGAMLTAVGFGPFALVAGAGLSVVVNRVKYHQQRQELLDGSPFSVILAAQKTFGIKKQSRQLV